MAELTGFESEALVRLRLITHNARLVDARKELNLTLPEMVVAASLSLNRLRMIENLRVLPTEDEILRIACVLDKPTEFLFPKEILSAIRAGVFSRRKVELQRPQVESLTEMYQHSLLSEGVDTLEEDVDRKLLKEAIGEVLDSLPAPQGQILSLRFGLVDGHDYTLEEVGKELRVNRERIRQTETKALKTIRCSKTMRDKLKTFY